MKKQSMKIAVVIFITHLFASTDSYSRTFSVNSLLDNSNYYTPTEKRLCSLRMAIQMANQVIGRDTIIFLANGTTRLESPLPDITDTAGVMIIGPGSDKLIIDAGQINELAVVFVRNSSHNVLTGFSMTSIHTSGVFVENSHGNNFDDLHLIGRNIDKGASLIEFVNSNHNTVTNSSFSKGGLGLRFRAHSDYNTAINCRSVNNRHSGMTIADSDHNCLRGNYIEASGDFGIFLIYGANDNVVEENKIINNRLDGVTLGEVGSDGVATSRNTICWNVLTGNQNPIFEHHSVGNLIFGNVLR